MKKESIKLTTWNLDWARPNTRRGDIIRKVISAEDPEVVCYTEGITDVDGYQLIDHLAVSSELNISTPKIIPRVADDGTRLSDHVGVTAILNFS